MGRHKGNRTAITATAVSLALAAMLFVTMGMPLLHPSLHTHHVALQAVIQPAAVSGTAGHNGTWNSDAARHHHCFVCDFLASFHVPLCPAVPDTAAG